MFNPRHLASLPRWMLAWFLLSLGVAFASPLIRPRSMELVCSSAGAITVIVHTDEGLLEETPMAMDCPLCVVSGAPPPAIASHLPGPLPLGHSVQSIPSARIAAATAAPMPARGPPSLS